jgi:hypothetical protein
LAGLDIPEEHRKALMAPLTLPDEATDNLLASLLKVPLSVQSDSIAKAAAAELRTASIEQPETAAAALVALHMTRARSDAPIDDFIANLLNTLSASEEFSDAQRERAAHQLLKTTVVRTAIHCQQGTGIADRSGATFLRCSYPDRCTPDLRNKPW